MAASQPRRIRIFISSPGDVGDERALALQVIDALSYDPLLRGKVTIEAVAWDKPGAGTPMLATMTPQEAINEGLPRPSECDIVIVIFWSRMGTPLPPEYVKPDNTRYLSGTEWEYLDAVTEAAKSTRGLPFVVVYRRTEDPVIRLNDPDFNEKRAQWERVDTFFAAFKNSDGSIRQGFNPYPTPEAFRKQLEIHLKDLIARLPEPEDPAASSAVPAAPLWESSPFPGLRAFTPDDAPIFFGRGPETDALLEKVGAQRFVVVVGASGSGKSSLVGAGLLPRLAANAIPGSKAWILPGRQGETARQWTGLRFTPGEVGNNPFVALALRLAPLVGQPSAVVADSLVTKPQSIIDLMAPLFLGKPDWTQALLFVDQFEELFTLVDARYQAGFIALLGAIAKSDRLRVVLTLRADFYGRGVENPALAELLKDSTFPLSTPNSLEMFEMVSRPAERAGLRFETGLVDRILQDTGSDAGALPLMAFALDELYKARTADSALTFAAYNSFGGVQGAIGERAEMLYKQLDPDAQNALFGVFRELVEVDERGEPTRRRSQYTQVARSEAAVRLINKLTEARLLVQGQGADGQAVVEVAHEALLRNWPRLSEYIAREKDNLRLRRQVEQAAQEWRRADGRRKRDYLLVGSRLDEAERWLRDFSPDEQDTAFIQASEKARTRRLHTLQETTAGAILAVIIAVAAIVLATVRRNEAVGQVNASNNQLLTATFAQGQAVDSAATVAFEAQQIEQTLTPVGPTLTAVQSALQAGNVRLLTATFAQGQAQNSVAAAQTQVGYAAATLTPVAQKAAALDMEAQAVAELGRQNSNAELAALLAIRSLKSAYYAASQNALLQASQQLYALRIFSGHSQQLWTTKFSPDGKQVLTSSNDGTARLWDVDTGQTIRTFNVPQKANVVSAVFSSDGKQILTASADGLVRLWDIDTGQVIRIINGDRTIIWSAVFSPDGKQVLTASSDKTARLWDISTGELIQTFSGHTDVVWNALFSPDGKQVLTVSSDKTARLWDAATGQIIHILSGHTSIIWSAAFSPDGKQVLTGSGDYTARLWDTASGQPIRTFSGHSDAIQGVAFSPDGKHIATASWDHTARLWDVASGKTLRIFSGDTSYVASVAFSLDGSRLVTGSWDNTATVWDATSGYASQAFIGHTDRVDSAVFSPDGKQVATGGNDNTVRLWDAETEQLIRTFSGHTAPVFSVVFSPDGKTILSSGQDGSVRLWDVASGQTLRIFSGNSGIIFGVRFSPDGKTILSGGQDGTARLWDVASGQTIRIFAGHAGIVTSVAFSPDGKQALTGSVDGTARLWDVASGQTLRIFTGHNDAVDSVAFSPDGKQILTGSRIIRRGCGMWQAGRRYTISTHLRQLYTQLPSHLMADISWLAAAIILPAYGMWAVDGCCTSTPDIRAM